MANNDEALSPKKTAKTVEIVKRWLSEPRITGPVIIMLIIAIVFSSVEVSMLKEYANKQRHLINMQKSVIIMMGGSGAMIREVHWFNVRQVKQEWKAL